MLFKFGTFWKVIILLLSTWAFYGLFGFEMSVITLLAFLLASMMKSTHFLL